MPEVMPLVEPPPMPKAESLSPNRVLCPRCDRKMKPERDKLVCSGYPLCQGTVLKSRLPPILPQQALLGAESVQMPEPSAPAATSWWAAPPPPPPPTAIGGTTTPPPPAKPAAPPMTPPTKAPPMPRSPTAVHVDLGGLPSSWCGRRIASSPQRVFDEDRKTLERVKKQEENRLYDLAILQPCPQCKKHDQLNHQGSSHLIQNLRCGRCSLRIATKWR